MMISPVEVAFGCELCHSCFGKVLFFLQRRVPSTFKNVTVQLWYSVAQEMLLGITMDAGNFALLALPYSMRQKKWVELKTFK